MKKMILVGTASSIDFLDLLSHDSSISGLYRTIIFISITSFSAIIDVLQLILIVIFINLNDNLLNYADSLLFSF